MEPWGQYRGTPPMVHHSRLLPPLLYAFTTLPYPPLPYLTISYHTLPYPILPYPSLPYPHIPYPTLPYPYFPCTLNSEPRTLYSQA